MGSIARPKRQKEVVLLSQHETEIYDHGEGTVSPEQEMRSLLER